MGHYIKSMRALVQHARGYGTNGFELAVMVSFDAKEFNRIKKTQDPLAHGMSQIKNVVLDATGARGIPSYARHSYNQAYPRASKGLVTLTVTFDISAFNAQNLGTDLSACFVHHAIDLNSTLEATRGDGHMFAKSVLASQFGN